MTESNSDDWGATYTGENRVVFTRSVDDAVGGAYHLYIMNVDGSGQRRLTQPGRGINVEADDGGAVGLVLAPGRLDVPGREGATVARVWPGEVDIDEDLEQAVARIVVTTRDRSTA